MSQFATEFQDTAAPLLGERYGEPITYSERDGKSQVVKATSITQAIVVGRSEQGYQDEDGRFFSRAIDVKILKTELAAVAEYDTITHNAEVWTIRETRDTPGFHLLVAVRPERQALTGGLYRRERRIAGDRIAG